jgi:MoxR-like ATPase
LLKIRGVQMKEISNDMIASLKNEDYVADTEIATALFLAEQLNKPILIEGEAGVGKTEIARVLAKMKDTELIRLQCYEGLDFNSVLYEWNYQKQILSMRVNELKNNQDISIDDLFSEEYLLYRPILKALMAEKRVVLLLDEVDRADEEFEALLLESLAEYQVTIPEFGTLQSKFPPYIILTSNRTRELTDALRRRCLYLWVNYPGYEKEMEIIQLKVPGLNPALASQITSLVQELRRENLNKVPGVAESIEWARALQTIGIEVLDRESVVSTVGCLLKDRQDITKFKNEMVQPLLAKVGNENGR